LATEHLLRASTDRDGNLSTKSGRFRNRGPFGHPHTRAVPTLDQVSSLINLSFFVTDGRVNKVASLTPVLRVSDNDILNKTLLHKTSPNPKQTFTKGCRNVIKVKAKINLS
jgi:hypothetical protein